MVALTGSERDLATYEVLLARLHEARGSPTGLSEDLDLIGLVMRGDPAAIERRLAWLDENQPQENLMYPQLVGTWLDEFEIAERAARSQTRPGNTHAVRRRGHLNLARILTSLGRWSEASAHLDRLRELDPMTARTERAALSTLPFLELPAAALEACRAELLEWRPEVGTGALSLHRAYDAHRRAYYLALVHARLGDREAALAYVDSLEALPDIGVEPAVPRALAATVRADLAWREGRPAREILELLEPVEGRVPAFLWLDPMVGQEHARFLRAWALYASGEWDEALRWLEHGFVNTPGWDYYKAPVRRLRAAVNEAAGRPDEARAAREAFEALWSDADARLFVPAPR